MSLAARDYVSDYSPVPHAMRLPEWLHACATSQSSLVYAQAMLFKGCADGITSETYCVSRNVFTPWHGVSLCLESLEFRVTKLNGEK